MLSNRTPLLVIVYLVKTCITSGIDDIDKDHYEMFPYCRSMSQEEPQTKSRAVNAEDAKENYRWATFQIRENREPISGVFRRSTCAGTIITDR